MKTKLIILGIILILIFPLVLGAGGIICYFFPRQYFSKVTMQVIPEGEHIGPMTRNNDSRFSENPFQIIQQKEFLYPVIDQLKLVKKWSLKRQQLPMDAVYNKLRKSMEIRAVRNTVLLQLGVYSTDAKEAADIANTIAVTYQEKYKSEQETLVNRRLNQLEEEIKIQRKKVEDLAKATAGIRTKEGIEDPNPEAMESGSANTEYLETKSKYITAKKILEAAELHYNSQKMQVRIASPPVKIWEKAEPAVYPSKPNVTVVMAVVFGVSLLFALPGSVLLLVGFLLPKPAAKAG